MSVQVNLCLRWWSSCWSVLL